MAQSSREIVTIQLGHYANFVGTHFWNAQESSFVYSPDQLIYPKEINHDVLFREGKTLNNEVTYTPRLVILDLKNSLCTLKQEGQLYDTGEKEENILWSNDVTLHKDDSTNKNDFLKDLDNEDNDAESFGSEDKDKDTQEITPQGLHQQESPKSKQYYLDESVEVWSDFSRVHFHPKTIGIVEEYRYGSGFEAFDIYGRGCGVYENMMDEIEDRLHYFIEECDQMQGIHIIADTYNGFAGLSSSLLNQLQDDYGKKTIEIFSVSPPVFPDNKIPAQCIRALNSLLCYHQLLEGAAAVVPLSLAKDLWLQPKGFREFPHLTYKPDLWYHSSAILAAGLESSSLPYRKVTGSCGLADVTDSLTGLSRKLLSLNVDLPMTLEKEGQVLNYLERHSKSLRWQCLTPHVAADNLPQCQSVSMRGVKAKQHHPQSASQYVPVEDVMSEYLIGTCRTSSNAIFSVEQPFPTTAPYPHIFNQSILEDGTFLSGPRPVKQPRTGVEQVSILSSLQSSPGCGQHLQALVDTCAKFKIQKWHKFLDAGLEEDQFRDSLDCLADAAESYVA